MCQFNLISEQVDRITAMAYVASVEYSLVCSMLVVDAMCEVIEPLPEVTENVTVFVAEFEEMIPKMIPFFDFMFMPDETVASLPQTDVAVEGWANRMKAMIEMDQEVVDRYFDAMTKRQEEVQPSGVDWGMINDRHEPMFKVTNVQCRHAVQMFDHIMTMLRRKRDDTVVERCIVTFLETFRVLKYGSIEYLVCSSRLREYFTATVYAKMIETYAKSVF